MVSELVRVKRHFTVAFLLFELFTFLSPAEHRSDSFGVQARVGVVVTVVDSGGMSILAVTYSSTAMPMLSVELRFLRCGQQSAQCCH